jgi:predicted permease
MFSHLRQAVRLLLKSPGFTLTTILILGFGIGANTVIFSFINSVVLKPLPYANANRLVLIVQTFRNLDTVPLNYADYLDFKASQYSFEDMAVSTQNTFTLTGQSDPERINGLYVDSSFFSVLDRPFVAGGPFGHVTDKADSSGVVVISEHLWRGRFRSDPKILGMNLILDGRSFQVVGVTAGHADELGRADLYVPVSASPLFDQYQSVRAFYNFFCFGRLKEGIRLGQAQADLAVINQDLIARYPATKAGFGIRLAPYIDVVIGGFSAILWFLEAAVAALLLITCANVANLLLARARERQKEMTIRAALGASRWRLTLQLFAESLVLALTGGGLGLLIGFVSVEAIKAFGPADLPRFQETRVDTGSVTFVLVTTLLTALLFGLLPAWAGSRNDLVSALKKDGERSGTAGPQRQRSQALLVGGQVALAGMLLIGAGLLTRSFQALQSIPLGFNPKSVLTADIFLSDAKYADQTKCQIFFDLLLEKVGRLPGVTSVAFNNNLPFHNRDIEGFGVAGQPDVDLPHAPLLDSQVISPNYFRALEMPLLRGRMFDLPDYQAGKEKVVIISKRIADRYFPDRDPIGQQIFDLNYLVGLKRNYYTIVGVAPNVQRDSPEVQQTPFQAYYPYCEDPTTPPVSINAGTVILRTEADPQSLTISLREIVSTMDPGVSLSNITSFDEFIGNTFMIRQVAMIVVGLFSIVALCLAAIGLYAVLSYSVIQRKRELGVRMALGAKPVNILGLVIGQGIRVAMGGLMIGIGIALILFQFIPGVLYGVSATDGFALGSAVVVLGLAAALACLLPGLRATRVNPMTALRE